MSSLLVLLIVSPSSSRDATKAREGARLGCTWPWGGDLGSAFVMMRGEAVLCTAHLGGRRAPAIGCVTSMVYRERGRCFGVPCINLHISNSRAYVRFRWWPVTPLLCQNSPYGATSCAGGRRNLTPDFLIVDGPSLPPKGTCE